MNGPWEVMVRIDVGDLLKRPVGTTRSYKIDEETEGAEGPCKIKGNLELMRTGRGILMRANIDTSEKCTCSRCLEEFKHPLRLNIQEEYFPKVDLNTGVPLPAPSEPNAFSLDENQELDTAEAVRQHIVISMPMKPVCKENCAGLCPTCGKNLNEGPCICVREVDARWHKLQGLSLRDKAESN